jgi:hypothetical protein
MANIVANVKAITKTMDVVFLKIGKDFHLVRCDACLIAESGP